MSQRPHHMKGWGSLLGGGAQSPVPEEIPATAGPELSSFAEKMSSQNEREKDKDTVGASLARRFGTLLIGGRGADDATRRGANKRTSILGPLTASPHDTADDPHEKEKTNEFGVVQQKDNDESALDTTKDAKEDAKEGQQHTAVINTSQSQPIGGAPRRAATVLDAQGRNTKHERRSSTSAATFSGATIRRLRRPSTAGAEPSNNATHHLGPTDENAEEIPEDEERMDHPADGMPKDELQEPSSDDRFKPIFLKGLFRCVRLRYSMCSKLSPSHPSQCIDDNK